MQPSRLVTISRLVLLAGAGLLLGAAAVSAQTVYRTVGADGRVTYSDQPPPPGAAVQAKTDVGTPGAGPAPRLALPYALQQVASRFPVALYTGADCAPCDSARQLLRTRGVPFTERTVQTNEDIDALKRISGDTSLPFGSIGGQQIRGFSDLEWTQYLDAAGYPETSQLPAQYRAAPPTPLGPVRTATAPVAPSAPAAPASSATTAVRAPAASAAPAASRPVVADTNPAGITF
jgi:glutaredoxin